jgi:carbonic anhydrase
LHEFLASQGLGKDGTDVLRVAGVALNLARPADPTAREFVLGQLKASHRLHKIREIYLINHEDCGAYGLEKEIDSAVELATHVEDLRAAKALLGREMPETNVLTYFLRLDGKIEPVG